MTKKDRIYKSRSGAPNTKNRGYRPTLPGRSQSVLGLPKMIRLSGKLAGSSQSRRAKPDNREQRNNFFNLQLQIDHSSISYVKELEIQTPRESHLGAGIQR